jgi:hypothetical protein
VFQPLLIFYFENKILFSNRLSSTIPLYHVRKKSKNSFYLAKQKNETELKSQTTTSFYKIARRATARRAKLIPPSKRNGRRFAPPANSSVKKKKVLSWSIFTTTLELTLSKIREKNNCPAPLLRGGAETQTRRLGRKKNSFGVWGKRKFFAPSPPPEIFFGVISPHFYFSKIFVIVD